MRKPTAKECTCVCNYPNEYRKERCQYDEPLPKTKWQKNQHCKLKEDKTMDEAWRRWASEYVEDYDAIQRLYKGNITDDIERKSLCETLLTNIIEAMRAELYALKEANNG